MPSNITNGAAISLSGGQDSATALLWALRNFEEVIAFSFDYGQKHRKELEFAEELCRKHGVPWEIIRIPGIFENSSLLDDSDHNDRHSLSDDLPASFVPGRNILFLSILAAKAINRGVQTIVTGVCQTDYSGYPDCRRETIDSLEKTLSLGIGKTITIETPLMYLTKAQTWQMAAHMGAVEDIVNLTLTDYNGDLTPNEWGFGKEDNPASILRANGYREAKAKGWLE